VKMKTPLRETLEGVPKMKFSWFACGVISTRLAAISASRLCYGITTAKKGTNGRGKIASCSDVNGGARESLHGGQQRDQLIHIKYVVGTKCPMS
jgi:hypothetical protein